MTNQADITKLLREASRQLGRERIRELLPPHTAIWRSWGEYQHIKERKRA